jgi:tRNA 2-selenouridine synthase
MKEILIDIESFLELRERTPVLDVRSEGEFLQSHVPGAINLAILNNEERKKVGIVYKNEGSYEAMIKGFELVGPRFHLIIKEAIRLFPEKKVLIYCWRGGMRSEIMSWILGMAGFEIFRLKGGYKVYRKLTYEAVRQKRDYLVLGGKTGVGKTDLLHHLKKLGESTIDLEDLARHKGSSFGGIGKDPQPSIEQFENLLAEEFFRIPDSKEIWIENESRRIGKVILAKELYEHIIKAPLIEIHKTREERIQNIKKEYAHLPHEDLKNAVKRLQKKLGSLRTAEAIEAIDSRQHDLWIDNLLQYYDRAYEYDLEENPRDLALNLDLSNIDFKASCLKLISLKKSIKWKTEK